MSAPLPEPAAHTLEWHARGGEDIGWLDFYAKDDKVPSDWDGPPPDEVQALFTAEQMHAHAAAAVAAERERCALLCEDWAKVRTAEHGGLALRNVAERIRGA